MRHQSLSPSEKLVFTFFEENVHRGLYDWSQNILHRVTCCTLRSYSASIFSHVPSCIARPKAIARRIVYSSRCCSCSLCSLEHTVYCCAISFPQPIAYTFSVSTEDELGACASKLFDMLRGIFKDDVRDILESEEMADRDKTKELSKMLK